MNPSFLFGLMLSSALALAAADKNFQSAAVGRRGRQILTGFRNGQALTNGAVVRKVLRRGRGQLAPTLAPALTPIRFAAAPAPFAAAPAPFVAAPAPFVAARAPLAAAPAPVVRFHHHAAPAPFVGPAPAPLFLRTPVPSPTPVVAVHHHGHSALPAIAPAFVAPPQLVAQVAAPQPLPAPAPAPAVEEEQVILAIGRDQARAPTLEYGAPSTVAPEVRAPVLGYGAPALEVVEVRDSYLPAEEEVVEVKEVDGSYGAPAVEVIEVRDSYLPAEEEVVEVRDSYLPAEEEVVEVRQGYLAAAAEERAQPAYSVPRTVANVKSNTVRSKPINIVRSHYNPPAETSVFDYSFESENGIKQEATGTMRLVDDTEVSVMRGSYSFIGADSVVYTVDWYADETGFHPSAPHLPKPVEPNHPEVAAAVRAQIAFAAEEDAAAAARGADSLAGYGSPAKGLPSYA